MSAPRTLAALSTLLAGAALTAAPAAAQPALSPDHGRLVILLHGSAVGTDDFSISRQADGWSAQGRIVLNLPGQNPERDSADLTLASDGSPLRYHWQEHSGRERAIDVEVHGHAAEVALHQPGAAPAVEAFSFPQGHVVLLYNNVYEDYVILARLYDWKARGPQKFSVLIPQDQTPGTITVQALGPHPIDGAVLDLLQVKSPGLEVELYVDTSHRLIRLRVPGSGAEAVRE